MYCTHTTHICPPCSGHIRLLTNTHFLSQRNKNIISNSRLGPLIFQFCSSCTALVMNVLPSPDARWTNRYWIRLPLVPDQRFSCLVMYCVTVFFFLSRLPLRGSSFHATLSGMWMSTKVEGTVSYVSTLLLIIKKNWYNKSVDSGSCSAVYLWLPFLDFYCQNLHLCVTEWLNDWCQTGATHLITRGTCAKYIYDNSQKDCSYHLVLPL